MGIVTDEPDTLQDDEEDTVRDEDRVDHVERIDSYRLFVSLGGICLGSVLGSGSPRQVVRVRFTLGAGRDAVRKEVRSFVRSVGRSSVRSIDRSIHPSSVPVVSF